MLPLAARGVVALAVMLYAVAVEGVIVLVLLWALLAGQPAGTQATLERIEAQSTENAYLRAVVAAHPTPTAICYTGTRHC